MSDSNQSPFKIKAAKILEYFRKLARTVVEIILLIICTAVVCICLLYMAKYLWFIFTASPVGEKYSELFAESSRITNDVLSRDFIRLAINLTLTSFAICLIIGIICKFFLITRYLYSARGYLVRIIFFGLPLTYIVAFYMRYTGDFSHIDTAFTIAVLPVLCVFGGCFSIADEFVPDLVDIKDMFGKKADKLRQKKDTNQNVHDFTERWKDYRKDIIILLVIIFAAGILIAILQVTGLNKIKELAPVVSSEFKAPVAGPEEPAHSGAVSGTAVSATTEQWYRKALLLIDSKDRNDFGNAIEYLNEAIILNPDYVNAYRVRGELYARLERYALAINDYDEVIRLKPKDGPAYNMRGEAYISSGNKEMGCDSLRRACELGYCKGYTYAKDEGDCR
jgi:tetratricopeptide (TPR) repeat protein